MAAEAGPSAARPVTDMPVPAPTPSSAPSPENATSLPPISSVELSVIVPTFNEQANIATLVQRLDKTLKGRSWEVIFVDDDSPDGTADRVREIGRTDHRVRCIQRIGRRGLSSACIEGLLSSSAPYQAVIDADLQHDETVLPAMLDALKRGEADIVIGSRYVEGGGVGEWHQSRAKISRVATRISRLVLHADLTDPMSGFFMLRRQAFADRVRKLSGIGFKILLDLFASSKEPLRFRELPYEFRSRHAGESKLDSQAAWQYLMLVLDKLVGDIVPVRFVAFALVGSVGVGVHVALLALLFKGFRVDFTIAQALATLVAMTSNFALNNILTYRDMRLRGWKWLRGWVSFSLACSVGAIANVGIASYLFQSNTAWVLAALAGILVGVVWNYAVTALYTWKTPAAR
jgi:dolichol-phosphate mannosyltransferase